jgi:hypothetical protein
VAPVAPGGVAFGAEITRRPGGIPIARCLAPAGLIGIVNPWPPALSPRCGGLARCRNLQPQTAAVANRSGGEPSLGTSPSTILFQFAEKSQIVNIGLERTDRIGPVGHALIERNRTPNKNSCESEHTNVILVCKRV